MVEIGGIGGGFRGYNSGHVSCILRGELSRYAHPCDDFLVVVAVMVVGVGGSGGGGGGGSGGGVGR